MINELRSPEVALHKIDVLKSGADLRSAGGCART